MGRTLDRGLGRGPQAGWRMGEGDMGPGARSRAWARPVGRLARGRRLNGVRHRHARRLDGSTRAKLDGSIRARPDARHGRGLTLALDTGMGDGATARRSRLAGATAARRCPVRETPFARGAGGHETAGGATLPGARGEPLARPVGPALARPDADARHGACARKARRSTAPRSQGSTLDARRLQGSARMLGADARRGRSTLALDR